MKTIITNKTIWNIAYPIILGSLAQTLITLTDTAFLGRVSEVALGASAMAGIYYYVFSTLAWGFSIGIQIIVARRLGEGKLNRIGVVFEHGLCFVFLLSMTLFLIQRYYSDVLLGASSSPPIFMRQPWNICPTAITGLYSVCFNFLVPSPLHRTLQHEDHRLLNGSHGHHQRNFQLLTYFRKIRFSGIGSRWCGTSLRDGRGLRLPHLHFLHLIKAPDQTIRTFLVPQTGRLAHAHRTKNGIPDHVAKTIVIRDMVHIFHAH